MSEMNRQIERKFSAAIELRLSQIEGIMRRTSPASVTYGEQMLEEMEVNARVRNVTYMGLYRRNGENETLYGGAVQPDDAGEFRSFLEEEIQVTFGFDESGDHVLLLGAEADYPMEDGGKSELLVVSFLMDDLEHLLLTQKEESLVYTYLLQQEGKFVVRGEYEGSSNYYEYLEGIIR